MAQVANPGCHCSRASSVQSFTPQRFTRPRAAMNRFLEIHRRKHPISRTLPAFTSAFFTYSGLAPRPWPGISFPNFVATITSRRRGPRKRPRSSSLSPFAYMSAVSKKFIPTSSAASITSWLRNSSIRPPKLLQPTPTTETARDPIGLVSTCSPLHRRSCGELHTRRLLVWPLAKELDPLLLHVRVVLRRLHEIDEALDRRLEPIL